MGYFMYIFYGLILWAYIMEYLAKNTKQLLLLYNKRITKLLGVSIWLISAPI